jgi:hypothetical protein
MNRRRYLEQNKAEAETNCQGIAQANSQNSKYYRVPLERKGNESEILKVRPPFLCISKHLCLEVKPIRPIVSSATLCW